MFEQDERLDLVDDEDRVVGQAWRTEVYRSGMSNFRVINAFLVNRLGELWLPRRAPTKRLFPMALDVSVGGHVMSGENYEQAFHRELREELGLDLALLSYRPLGYLTPYRDGVSAFMQVYEIPTDTSPDYNRNDFDDALWLSPEAALARIRQGEPAKDDLPRLIRRFYI